MSCVNYVISIYIYIYKKTKKITNANKGSAVVIVETNDYIKEAEHQLNDKDNYHILPQEQ